MTRLQGQLTAYVLFTKPDGFDEFWEQTDLWTNASIITGVTLVEDQGMLEGKKFGAKTSGQTYLYAPDGRLLFAGGITPSRSHEGDSVGRRRIISLVERGEADRNVSAVFGCPLSDEEAHDFRMTEFRFQEEPDSSHPAHERQSP